MWKTKVSNKLFFYEYPYKISITCKGASYLRQGLNTVLALPDQPVGPKNTWTSNAWRHHKIIDSRNEAIAHKLQLIEIGSVLCAMDDIKLRIEGATCNVFVKDQTRFDDLTAQLGKYIKEVYVPSDPKNIEFLNEHPHHVVVKELPKGNMRFRLHFSSSKRMSKDIAVKFLSWADKLTENSVHLPSSLRRDLTQQWENIFVYGRYFYVKDEKIAALVHMWFPDLISRVDKFISQSEVDSR